MHVVFGANGRVGGETAGALIERGEPVRVVVRRPEQGDRWKLLGAEVAVASIDDSDAVSAALSEAKTAFLLSPPPVSGDPFERAAEIGSALAAAVRSANLPKAVVLSSVGAQHASGTGVIVTLHQLEAALANAVPETVYLRPGYFVENWSDVAGAAAEGILPTFLDPDQVVPMVSTLDVGRTAADLLSEAWTGERIIELNGPGDWTANHVAAAFSDVLGRPVSAAFVPPEQRAAILSDSGIPAEVASALLGMYEGIANGIVRQEDGTERQRGTVSLATAIERFAAQVQAAA